MVCASPMSRTLTDWIAEWIHTLAKPLLLCISDRAASCLRSTAGQVTHPVPKAQPTTPLPSSDHSCWSRGLHGFIVLPHGGFVFFTF